MKIPTLRIHDWEDHQHQRKDRQGPGPWIKVYRALTSNPKWLMLTDAERGQLVAMWLTAGCHDGNIPADPEMAKRACQMDAVPDLNKFIDLGWLDGDRLTSGQPVVNQTSTEIRGEEIRKEKNRTPTESPSSAKKQKSKPNGYKIPTQPEDVKNDFDRAVYNWNVTAQAIGLPAIVVMNNERKRRLNARLKEVGIDGWNRALEVLETDSFAKGEEGKWKATFDFFLQPTSLAKMIEGGYRND